MSPRPDWWETPEAGGEFYTEGGIEKSAPRVPRTHHPRLVTYKVPKHTATPDSVGYKGLTAGVALLASVIFMPIGYINVGDWEGFWFWFIIAGIPLIIGVMSGIAALYAPEPAHEDYSYLFTPTPDPEPTPKKRRK